MHKLIVLRMLNRYLTIWLMALLALTACDKLEDSDVIGETLPGTWAFSYKASEQLDFEMSFQCIIFRHDGTCSLTYPDGQENGTYRASNAAIKIDADIDGEVKTYLWRVLEMSPYRVVAEYAHQMQGGREIVLTVTLDKLTDGVDVENGLDAQALVRREVAQHSSREVLYGVRPRVVHRLQ